MLLVSFVVYRYKHKVGNPITLTKADLTPITARIIKLEIWHVRNQPKDSVTMAMTDKGQFMVNVAVALKEGEVYKLQVVRKRKSGLGVIVYADSTTETKIVEPVQYKQV